MGLKRGTAKLRAAVRRRRFVTAYLQNAGDGKAAWLALRPAVTPASAAVSACRYLARSDVREEIAAANECLGTTTRERLIRELEAIAFTPLSALVTWNEEGKRRVKDSRLLTPQEAAAVHYIESEETTRTDGSAVVEQRKLRLGIYNKQRAMELIAKIQGFAVERHEVTGRDGGPIEHAVRFYLPAPARAREPVVIEAPAALPPASTNGAQQNGDNPGYTENGGGQSA